MTEKRKPGRPRKADQQFSVRLPYKLKFGLEALARAQEKSLSDAVAWAVSLALKTFEIDSAGTPLGEVLDAAWEQNSDSERLRHIYLENSSLLSFADKAACELAYMSYEYTTLLEEEAGRRSGYTVAISSGLKDEYSQSGVMSEIAREKIQVSNRLAGLYLDFVRKTWPAIHRVASKLADQGKSLAGRSVLEAIGLAPELDSGRETTWTLITKIVETVEYQNQINAE